MLQCRKSTPYCCTAAFSENAMKSKLCLHPHIGPRCWRQRRMVRIAGFPSVNFLARSRAQPGVPPWPPRAFVETCPLHPVRGLTAQIVTRIMAVFLLGGRVHDPRDMARLRHKKGLVLGTDLLKPA